MNRIKALCLSLLMLLSLLLPLRVRAAVDKRTALAVISVKLSVTKTKSTVSFAVRNNTGKTVVAYTMRFRFYNKNNKRIYEYENIVDNFAYEMTLYPYVPYKGLAKGRTDKVTETQAMYVSAKRVEVAVSEYTTADGERVILRTKELSWYGSDGKKTLYKGKDALYQLPSEQTLSDAATFSLGYSFVRLYEYDAAYYKRSAGLWVLSVKNNSMAQKAGIRADDVIVSVDGVSVLTDPFAVERGKAKVAYGETVDIVFMRKDKKMTAKLSLGT